MVFPCARVVEEPIMSICRCSHVGLSEATIWRILRKDLPLKTYEV